MKKINKILLIGVFVILILFTILYSLNSSNAYYTNLNKYFSDSKTNDVNGGVALKRISTEFIVEGCGTGTMLDSVTGLCWDKNLNHNGSSLQWSTVNTYAEPTWNNVTKVYSYPSGKAAYPAFSYCEDLILGGNTDWRLPSKNELHTLIDQIGASGSTCTTITSFGFTNCQNNYYWADREYKPATTSAGVVLFNNGYDADSDKAGTHYVVCVR